MEIEFSNDDLELLYTDSKCTLGFDRAIVKAYRKRVQLIVAASDERDLYEIRANRFKKLKGKRAHQYSMRLNDQWRLILTIKKSNPNNIVVVIGIEDYHD